VETRPNDAIEVLLFNTESIMEAHLNMGRTAIADALDSPQVANGDWSPVTAPRYILADSLKDWYEDMFDDIQVKKWNYNLRCTDSPQSKRNEDEYRQTLIQAFVRREFEETDWHDLADTILNKIREIDKHREE
jgi:hypothetical protein